MGHGKRRRQYDSEFKEQAARLALEGDRTLRELAADLGVGLSVLSRWKIEYLQRLDGDDPCKPASTLEEENRELRKQMASLRAQRDILKKALSIVSRPNGDGLSS